VKLRFFFTVDVPADEAAAGGNGLRELARLRPIEFIICAGYDVVSEVFDRADVVEMELLRLVEPGRLLE